MLNPCSINVNPPRFDSFRITTLHYHIVKSVCKFSNQGSKNKPVSCLVTAMGCFGIAIRAPQPEELVFC